MTISLSILQIIGCFSMVMAKNVSYNYHDYCIVGAGPAGLQLGYFMQTSARDYMIYEKSSTPGHFFTIYPRHRKLISLNKRHSGQRNKHFSFRHDWNSLISDDESLLLKYYSKELFPSADVLVKYLHDYQKKLGIKVQFNTEVNNIRKVNINGTHLFVFNNQFGNTYYCRTVILATGMWKPNIPNIQGIEKALGYESFPTNPEMYENKSVLILGIGNSAMETADSISSYSQYVHVLSRHQDIQLAWSTHYVGDIRAVNNNLLDTFLLKSLDGITFLDMNDFHIQERNGKYFLILNEHYLSNRENVHIPDNFALRNGYDVIIRCLGFTFDNSIFAQSNISRPNGKARKYPAISENYESVDFSDLFIAGTAAHSLDFRRSAGGFIHGFRYTSQSLHRLLEWRYEKMRWPFITVSLSDLMNIVLKRLNEGSGIYQMYGILGDIIIINEDSAVYLEEFPIKLLHKLNEVSGHSATKVIVLYLDYGWLESEDSKFEAVASKAHLSYFLHPILYYYNQLPTDTDFQNMDKRDRLPRPASLHHIVEDFLILWQSKNEHIRPLRRWLEHVLEKNFRHYYSENCLRLSLTYRNMPLNCQRFLEGQGLVLSSKYNDVTAIRKVEMATLY